MLRFTKLGNSLHHIWWGFGSLSRWIYEKTSHYR